MNIHNLRDVDLNLLLILLVVLEERNVTRAAERLGKTQSAISHALNRLRTVLGDELLVRAGGQMVATPQGEALLPEVRAVLDAVDQLLAPAGEVEPAGLSRVFEVEASELAQLTLWPALVKRLSAEAPGASLRLVARGGELVLGEQLAPSPGQLIEPLYEDGIVYVSAGGAAGSQRAATPHVHILSVAALDEARRALGVEDRDVVAAVESLAAAPVVAAAMGAAVLMPARAASALRGAGLGLEVAPLKVELPSVCVSMMYPERLRRDAAHRWLRHAVTRCAQEVS